MRIYIKWIISFYFFLTYFIPKEREKKNNVDIQINVYVCMYIYRIVVDGFYSASTSGAA